MKSLATYCIGSFAALGLNAQIAVLPTANSASGQELPSSITAAPHPLGQDRSAIVQLGGAGNVYTILLGAQNQVCYNADLNTVIFGHRQNPAENGNLGGNGTMRFDVSTDGGTTWSLNRLLTPGIYDGSADTIIGVRYPSTTLYNPPGNTDPSNAAVVSIGMALNTLDTALDFVNTGHIQQSSAHIDGSNSFNTFSDPFGDRTTHSAYGSVSKNDGTLWCLVARQSNSTLNADTLSFKEFLVNKGTWNNGTQTADWEAVDTLNPQMVVYGDYLGTELKNVQVQNWNMGFSPDGQVGYAVIIGKEYDGIPCGPMPLVWKTTDGGTNWNQLPNHDFSQEPWVIDNIAGTNDTGEPRPYFADTDLTVDANGTLHLVSHVLSQYLANSPDSVGFIFSSITTQFIVHTATSDGVTWSINKLADKLHSDYEYPVLNLPSSPFQGDRPQACRTLDGTHVFFTWNQGEEGGSDISLPDIRGTAFDASTGLWAAPKTLSSGTDVEAVAWWHTVAPVCISNGDDFTYELPTVVANPGAYADVSSGFTYIKGIGFDEGEFVVGIAELNSTPTASVFPNPSEGRFTVSLLNMDATQVNISDATGRLVRSFSTRSAQFLLDLTTEEPGIYLLSMYGKNGRVSARLLIQ
ncbi:MAG: T9SS type A sorting domain-containing protein [Flavobacteriales bacterium]|nr:T9SS type A sorting domain-containing protein [Flavobacteriales bacterium]